MYFLAVLTFELIEHTDGLNDIPRVGKNLNDVILHGAHHTEPWLMTCNRKGWITLTYSEFDIDHINKSKFSIIKSDRWDIIPALRAFSGHI